MRIEKDTMGEVQVPDDAYYGAQTQRAVDNFPISGRTLPPELIHALGAVKWACAKANEELEMFNRRPSACGGLTEKQVEALLQACKEVAEGKWDAHFPVDVFQTGSGTSTNMNANEVIARRANEILQTSEKNTLQTAACNLLSPIHPNDHVNLGQSTNDIFPTAIHVAMVLSMNRLSEVMTDTFIVLRDKAEQWKDILKIGRTHLADATPITLGQEFSGLQHQILEAMCMIATAKKFFEELPAGGTAVGTGINSHQNFGVLVASFLNLQLGLVTFDESAEPDADGLIPAAEKFFQEAPNHFASNAQRDILVNAHSLIKSAAVTIMNVANNIRWLGSGPRCGFYEIIIPDLQPGSSIMPGKVNPVLCEALMQVCAKVIGNDAAMTACGITGGQFQLNIMMPVMADIAIESVKLLGNGLEVFTEKCLKGLEPNIEKCREGVEKSLAMATALNPVIGYEKAAEIAKEAFKTGKTVREVCTEKLVNPGTNGTSVLTKEQLDEILDPLKMTGGTK